MAGNRYIANLMLHITESIEFVSESLFRSGELSYYCISCSHIEKIAEVRGIEFKMSDIE